jgi:cAMP-dependent protein kinase regulator
MLYKKLKNILYLFKFFFAVLDVDAFERLLGPCMNIMKRNIEDYENQLVKIFGSKQNMTDVR